MCKENSKLSANNPLNVYEFTKSFRENPIADVEYETHNFMSPLTLDELADKFEKRGHKVERATQFAHPTNNIVYIDHDSDSGGFWISPAVIIDMSIGDVSRTITKGMK